MGFLGSSVRFLLTRILPVLVFTSAIVLGWLSRQELPLGTFFATVFPLMKFKLPATIVGHGKMTGVPPVPDDMKPAARPEGEMFLELPGGYKMPQNGLGMCCRYSAYDDVLVRRTVLWYLLLGGRLIDTAHLYLNHEAIGLGIKDAIARGIPREEIFVTTKIFTYSYGYNTTMTVVPTYLDQLGLEYIDLVLMHFPSSFPMTTNECTKRGISNSECRAETWKALSELQQKGIMRNIGVSNFVVHHLEDLQASGVGGEIAVNQMQYNPWAPDFSVETFEYCQKNGIAVTAYASLGGSLQHSQTSTVDTLNSLSDKYNKSIAQIMLRWALQSNAAVIPGTGNPKHMEENLAVYEFELSEQDFDAIEALRGDEEAKKFFYMDPPKD